MRRLLTTRALSSGSPGAAAEDVTPVTRLATRIGDRASKGPRRLPGGNRRAYSRRLESPRDGDGKRFARRGIPLEDVARATPPDSTGGRPRCRDLGSSFELRGNGALKAGPRDASGRYRTPRDSLPGAERNPARCRIRAGLPAAITRGPGAITRPRRSRPNPRRPRALSRDRLRSRVESRRRQHGGIGDGRTRRHRPITPRAADQRPEARASPTQPRAVHREPRPLALTLPPPSDAADRDHGRLRARRIAPGAQRISQRRRRSRRSARD